MEYEESKKLLVDDLRSIPNDADKVRIFWGEHGFSPNELAKEIEDETKIGKEHIRLHMQAMSFIEGLEAKPKKKLRCRFWKK